MSTAKLVGTAPYQLKVAYSTPPELLADGEADRCPLPMNLSQCSFPRRKGTETLRIWRARECESLYNGGLAAEPPAGSRGRAPGQGVRRQSPPEAENILTLTRANSALSLKSNASNLEQSTPVNKRRI